MEYKEIIHIMEAVREHCGKHAEQHDSQEASWRKTTDALTEAMDIISDYEQATAQTAEMIKRYETAEMTVRINAGVYTCPACGKRSQPGHTHCHWCGKKLSWDREAYARRDYPHLSRRREDRRDPKEMTDAETG